MQKMNNSMPCDISLTFCGTPTHAALTRP